MKTARRFFIIVAVFVAGVALGAALVQHRAREDRIETAASSPKIPIGFKCPKEVNGASVPSGFAQMIPAFHRGHLCVKYDREGADREVCFDRRASGETVVDRAI